jgi:hypothetical protein
MFIGVPVLLLIGSLEINLNQLMKPIIFPRIEQSCAGEGATRPGDYSLQDQAGAGLTRRLVVHRPSLL